MTIKGRFSVPKTKCVRLKLNIRKMREKTSSMLTITTIFTLYSYRKKCHSTKSMVHFSKKNRIPYWFLLAAKCLSLFANIFCVSSLYQITQHFFCRLPVSCDMKIWQICGAQVSYFFSFYFLVAITFNLVFIFCSNKPVMYIYFDAINENVHILSPSCESGGHRVRICACFRPYFDGFSQTNPSIIFNLHQIWLPNLRFTFCAHFTMQMAIIAW